MKTPTPSPEHLWLQKFLGEWTYEAQADMGPDQPPYRATGTESVLPLGPFWIRTLGRSVDPTGEAFESILTVGFDPTLGRFVGTWIGSPMAKLWIYECHLSPSGDALHLESDGPSMTDPAKIVRYRDTLHAPVGDTRDFTASIREPDGSWKTFMTSKMHRVK